MAYYIYDGIISSGITLSSWWDPMWISSGGTANNTTVYSEGSMYICSGGTANKTTVNSGGIMDISSGGTANSTTVNDGGKMYINSGGTATNVIWTPCEGFVSAAAGAYVTYASEYSGVYFGYNGQLRSHAQSMDNKVVSGSMYVMSGGVANSTTVNSGGAMYISSGGTANSTTVSWGFMDIYSGGVANNTVNDGDMYIYSGGVANNTVNDDGYMLIFSGGTANSTTVNSGGSMYISSGGTATNVSWTPCIGSVYAADGAYVTYASTYSSVYFGSGNRLLSHTQTMSDKYVTGYYCSMYVMSGGTANSTTVNSDGKMYISSGGTANSTTVYWGSMFIYSGGTANSTTVSSGRMYISSGGTANSTTVYWGSMFIYSGGTANSTTVNDGGNMYISYGGTANSTTVNDGGYIYISSGGSATNLTLSAGGRLGGISFAEDRYFANISNGSAIVADNVYIIGLGMNIISGGTANNITVNSGGNMYISSGGTANNTTVNSRGYMYISSGGTANSTTINDGYMNIFSGGTANSTTVRGYMYISSGGTANSTTINDGYMNISSGGVHRGSLQIESGATVSAHKGAKIDFNVADRKTEDGYLINDLSLIQGAPTYTITVSAEQEFGTYKLAQGADNFTRTLTIGEGTSNYGSITVNGEDFVYNDTVYSLDQLDGNLTLTIAKDITPPTLTINGNATALTNKDVVLKISANENCTILYNINNGEWQTYSDGITVTANGTVNIKATDEAGNVTEKSVVVDMIDKVAPTLEISGNAEVATNQDVVLTATASDGIVEYWDGAEWIEGNSITATENGTYQFRVTDEAGNVTEKSVVVDQIDKIAPTLEISGNAEVATNQDVILTATASDGTVEYFANGKWNSGNSLTVAENGTYQFRVTDAAGNVTEKSVVVDQIDKVAPTKPEVFASTTAPTNKNVTVSAEFSLDSIKQQFSYDNQTWYDYESGIVLSRNGVIYFRGIDAVGNVSEVAEYTVTNIDKIAPSAPSAFADVTTLTNNPVTVSAAFSNDSDRKQYSFDGYTWSSYTSGIVMANNGTVYFRAVDDAGNISDTTEYVVENIDRIAPAKPTAYADITGDTTGAVTVSAIFSNDSVITEFSLDNKTWQTYTDGVVMESNGTIYFRGIDAAGNVSQTAVYEVNNIIAAPDTIDDDLDGNGKADVILVHTKQGYSGAWLTTGDKSVIKWGSLSDVKAGTEILGTGTLYGSGNDGQDIFFADSKSVGAWNVVEGKVTGYKSIMSVNSTTNVLGLGDFNGDGATDILLRSTNGDLGYYNTDGTGFTYLKGLGKEWTVAAIGDLNGDGLDDVVLRHDAGFAGTFLTQKNGTVKWANLDTLAKDMTIVGTGDFNGDGVDDVLLQNKSNGWVGAWLVEDGRVDSFIGLCNNKNTIEQIADFNGDGIDDLRIRAGADIGVLYVNGADDTTWQYFKSVGTEWDTSFSALA